VARGYLNRPELTAARFLADPFAGQPGARMYRTGDLGRWLPDGTIEYLGRNDCQVKIRGFRIEPGEIEACLVQCAGVREAVVIAREDSPGDRRLVAYLVAEAGILPEPAGLRQALAQQLADYMLPSAFVRLDALPLTPNGKVDRKALPAPDDSAFVRTGYEAPQGETEQALAAIWQSLLGIERVGRQDHFFELGGHSLLVVRLIAALQSQGLNVPVRAVFEHTRLAELATTIERFEQTAIPENRITADSQRITPAMLPLLELTQEDIDRIVSSVPGGVRQIQDIYPLTPLQEGVLYHYLLAESHDPYLNSSLLAFATRQRLEAFIASLNRVIVRHDILRTAVRWEGLPQPVQVVLRRAELTATQVHLSPTAGDAADQLFSMKQCRLDLRQAPLFNLLMANDEANDRWLLCLQYHHLCLDHTTLAILLDEIHADERGERDQLSASIPFRNHVAQVRARAAATDDKAFFHQQLAEVEEPTLPGGLTALVDMDEAILPLPDTLAGRIRRQAQQEGISAASLFHLAWGHVIGALSGRDDVVFGTMLLGRLQDGREQALGLFINTLPLRLTLADITVRAALDQTHRRLTDLLAHEHASLTLAQQCSGVAASQPLFSALLNYRHDVTPANADAAEDPWPGIELLKVEERTNYPLTLSVDDALHAGFSLKVQADRRLGGERIGQMMQHVLTQLIDALEQSPEQPLHRLSVLPPDERHQVLTGFNHTHTPYLAELCVHERVEQQAVQHPERIALVFQDQSLSYGELNRRANQLAHHLRGLGIGADDRVAICTERHPEMIVCVLATLKAGAACVPLDPEYPSARLAFMLKDSAPGAILVDQHGLAVLDNLTGTATVLHLTRDASQWATASGDNPSRSGIGLTPDNLAYVIYTSGSTGQPKGVAMPHAPLVNLLHWQAREQAAMTTLQFASFGFDVAFQEILSALTRGGKLVMIASEARLHMDRLLDVIQQQAVERVFLPVAALQTLAVTCAQTQQGLPVKEIITAGERLLISSEIRALCQRSGPIRLHNQYGPAETHVVTEYQCVGNAADWPRLPPIGYPIYNNRLYILDTHQQPVPLGIAGEIYIGGAGVARGYLNRPDLTAERFLTDPFSPETGARMYRTGDLGRWLADGSIEYLGRNDFQVKIRGFRIEPGEVESVLQDCAGVREAVVIAQHTATGDHRLVAYYTLSDEALTVEALKQALAQRLPVHMVPSAYVRLEQIPLTPNGKVDRKALPAPDDSAFVRTGYEAPQGETEQALAAIWQDLLGIERVGRQDHFFELGGHSLLAVRLVSHIRSALHRELPLAWLFAHPTLHALAAVLQDAAPQTLSAITPLPDDVTPPLSLAQQRLWFLTQLDPAASAAYVIQGAVQLQGTLNVSALTQALDRIMARHAPLRTRFEAVQGDAVQVIEPAGLRPFPLAVMTVAPGDDLPPFTPVFDLRTGPLVQGQLLHVDAQAHLLRLALHHIIADGWSVSLFINELSTLYAAFNAGQPDPLPPLRLRYGDYAAWQRQHLQGEVLQRQQQYWVSHLSGAPDCLTLPADHPRPPTQRYDGATLTFTLERDLTDALYALSRRHDSTLFMTLLVAWAALLGRLAGQDDVVIGTPVAGRTRTELEGLMGMFVNTQPLRIDLSGQADTATLLARVRETVIAAQAYQDIPFEQIVEAVAPARSLAHSPLFQVTFSVQNTPSATLALDGLTLTPLTPDGNTAQFDLSLGITESDAGLNGQLNYATALFETHTIRRFLAYWQTLLRGMVADTHQPVAQITLLSDAERQQVLYGFNDTAADFPADICIHQCFEQQAARQPDAVAVVFENESLSYGELNRRANRLAHWLTEWGVRPDNRVAMALERSPELIVALLATLKAGGAYVPLDPGYPTERLQYMLADSAPVVLITTTALNTRIAADCPVIELDNPTPPWATCPTDNIAPATRGLTPRHLAYVIYTSGSTGQPKGVMIEHRSLMNYLYWSLQTYPNTASDRIPMNSSIGFDATITSVFVPILAGKTLYIIDSQDEIASLYRALVSGEPFGFIKLTPSYLDGLSRLLISDPNGVDIASLPGLQQFILGGEAVLERHLSFWRQHRPDVRIVNEYGPTETVVGCCIHTLTDLRSTGAVPIGRPIANTRMYILDEHRQPVPVGVVGEIYIGGVGVARGYLNRADLTAERFLADPFVNESGARLYRTGDLGCWQADGTLDYRGRNDFQIKIRGFRIEPGEVESALQVCDGIDDAVVIAQRTDTGDHRLVAYYTLSDASISDGSVSIESLKQQLARRLPDFMVPSAYVRLDALPLTPNGKLDRHALPAPDQGAVVSRGYEAPAGEIETALAQIWQDVLGVARVGRHDHFFELGGHSLLAVRLLNRMREEGLDLPLASLFTTPILCDLAMVIGPPSFTQSSSPFDANPVPLRPEGSLRPLFLVHETSGDPLVYSPLAALLPSELPVYVLQAIGIQNVATVPESIEALAACHIQAIRRVQPQGPYRFAGWSMGGVVAYEITVQLLQSGERVEFLGMIDSCNHKGLDTNHLQSCDAQQVSREMFIKALVENFDVSVEQVTGLCQIADLDQLVDRCIERAYLPADISREDVLVRINTIETLTRLLQRYTPSASQVPIYLYTAEEALSDDVWRGWRDLVDSHSQLRSIGGTHGSIMRQPLLSQLADAIRDDLLPKHGYNPCVIIQRGSPSRLPLFCIPGAGASAFSLLELALSLPASLPVHALEAPGLADARIAPYNSVESYARAYTQKIRQTQAHGPYHLLGHSFGGWIAFEIALQLQEHGESVANLMLIDSEAPDPQGRPSKSVDRVETLMKLIEIYNMTLDQPLGLVREDFKGRDADAQLQFLFAVLKGAGLFPENAQITLLQGIVQVMQANLNSSYTPRARFHGQVHLVSAMDSDRRERQGMESGWRKHVEELGTLVVPGNHMTMLLRPNIESLAGYLWLRLDTASNSGIVGKSYK
ncbi:amino acid adenylation domain-containing protein, partial [Dickeya dadantii]|uniref:non-ribosomal peptide synthetase n=1 Tax=Dickeya dadantii TaxID=204038 RepID=UPI00149583A6